MSKPPNWAKAIQGKTIERVVIDDKDRAGLELRFTDGTTLGIVDLATPRLSIGYFFGESDDDTLHGEIEGKG